MNTHLLFDFVVNKENNTIDVSRQFAAPVAMVWDAWTRPELLDQWWAPKPYRTETKSMDFRVGGTWLYAMISPENEAHWCRADYLEIESGVRFTGLDAFCDAEGAVNSDMPRTNWDTSFATLGEGTIVQIRLSYERLADLEKIIAMGFKEGFSMALGNLDQYLEAQFRLRAESKTGTGVRTCTYLNFDGKTEEAFLFYQSVFKTDFAGKGIQRFGDVPEGNGYPAVADNLKKMILHVELPILGNHVLMGTDAPKEMGFELIVGNNMHLCLEPESREETDRLFRELSEGGQVTMPMADMFFGAYFGSFTDKYGINWMLNFQNRP